MFNRISPLMNAEGVLVAGTPTSVVPAATPAAPVVAAPVVTPAVPIGDPTFNNMSADAFKARLAEERAAAERAVLKKIGVEKPEDAKARLEAFSKIEQEKLTEAEKQQAKIAALEPAAKRAESMEATIKKYLASEEAAIPADKKGLLELAPSESTPDARLEWIANAKAKGLFGSSAPAVAASAAPVLPPNPATTIAAPGPAAPQPAGTLTPKQQYADLKKASPNAAAIFYRAHRTAIEADKSP